MARSLPEVVTWAAYGGDNSQRCACFTERRALHQREPWGSKEGSLGVFSGAPFSAFILGNNLRTGKESIGRTPGAHYK